MNGKLFDMETGGSDGKRHSTDVRRMIRAIAGSATFLAFVSAIGLVVYGRDLFVPIALAVLITLLLNAMANRLRQIPLGPWRLPHWLCVSLSLVLIVWLLVLMVDMITATVLEMSARAPSYQTNAERLMGEVEQVLGLSTMPSFSDLLDKIDLRLVVRSGIDALSDLAARAGVIMIYVLFLLMEQKSFDAKLAAFSSDEPGRRALRALFDHMANQTRTYVFIKTINAALCGVIAYVVMLAVGLDFSVFWAVLTFLTYYIPTFGSLIAIACPTLLALIQFETISEALIILIVSGGLQTAVANLLEPRYMGRSMNISPFVIIVSLFAWGSVWGLAGMFLCVPLTVIAMIVFSHFPRTHRIAVLLSSDGQVDRPPDLHPLSPPPEKGPS